MYYGGTKCVALFFVNLYSHAEVKYLQFLVLRKIILGFQIILDITRIEENKKNGATKNLI